MTEPLTPVEQHIVNAVRLLQASPHGATLAQRFTESTNPLDQAIGAAYALTMAGQAPTAIVTAHADPQRAARVQRGKPRGGA
jgi:hypothetical protein